MNHERLLRQTVSRRVEGDVINVYNVQFIQSDSRKECGDAYLSRLPTLFKNGNTETEDRWFYKKKNELPGAYTATVAQGELHARFNASPRKFTSVLAQARERSSADSYACLSILA